MTTESSPLKIRDEGGVTCHLQKLVGYGRLGSEDKYDEGGKVGGGYKGTKVNTKWTESSELD